MREPGADRPRVLEDEDIDGTSGQFRDWRIELIHLGRGTIRRSSVFVPLGFASIALFQVRRATVLRGLSPESQFSLISTSPASPPVRVGARALNGGIWLMLGPQAAVDLYLPKDCCAFVLSSPCSTVAAATGSDDLARLPAARAELRSLAPDHSALLSRCMDLIESFRRSNTPQTVGTQVVCRLRELLAPTAATLFAHSDALPPELGEKAVRRSAVAHACAYIDENLRRSITLDDLCTAAGVRSRTLEYGFRAFYDVGPMTYLRSVRLCRVRRDLLNIKRPSISVARTARRCTFTHMGQFSRDYRLLFGESPSSTLARSRSRLSKREVASC
jgi:AraC-like DNA-binding protein